MSVTTTTSRIEYTADGVQTTFPYTFQIFATSDLEVYVNGVLKTLTTDYTVTGAGDAGGGDVEFLIAPADTLSVVVRRVLPQTQQTVYPSNDKFPAKVHEAALDRAIMLIQQLAEVDARSLKLAVTSLYTDLSVPDPEADKFLRWKNDLSGLSNADVVPTGALGLPVAVSNGGTGAATPDAAIANLKIGTQSGAGAYVQTRIYAKNSTGADVATGDICALAVTGSLSAPEVVVDDTQDARRPYVVATEDVVAGASGYFAIAGVVAKAKLDGAISVGRYVSKASAATKTKALRDTGVACDAATGPPVGAIGLNLTLNTLISGTRYSQILLFGTGSGGSAATATAILASQVFGG